ncbi:MAG TPA: protein kinase [Anaerolineales bacterium]|nr:protein kinase [Anaerolineales bacterium]
MPLQPGSVLASRYEIEDKLGRGGMGAVYLAYDQTLNMRVAVKENLNVNPEAERQFRKEAELLAKLRHPHLPRVTDYFILGDQQYLVMDYIEGIDLHARAAQRRPSVDEVLGWAKDLGSALTYLHSRPQPIIHRDIKPSNVKVQPDGTLFLVDFGIAKIFESDQAATTTGARGLTPGFSPPEQYGGARTDARSDQYALSATLYSLMTGHSPPDSIERMLNKQQLLPASTYIPEVAPHVDAALERAMAIDMEDRFPDVATFLAALGGELAVETIRAAAVMPTVVPTVVAPPRKKSRRLGVFAIGGAGLIGLIILGGAGALALGAFKPPAPSPTVNVPVVIEITSTPEPTQPPDTPTPEPTAGPEPTATSTRAPGLGGAGRIVFVSNREDNRTLQLWTMDTDGSDPAQLTFGPGDKVHPRWSPDGQRILYSADGGNDLGLDLFVINADGTGLQNLTNSVGDDTEGRWNPRGNSIAFTSTRIGGSEVIHLMPIECPAGQPCIPGEAKAITMTGTYAPESSAAWSPDGGQLVVIAEIRGALGRIFIGGTPGEGQRFDRRDNIIGADDLDWSPDGKLLSFTWYQPGFNEIYAVPVDDSTRTQRLTKTVGNKQATFSPDGLFLAFTSTRDQNAEIYRMTVSGADQVNLTNDPGLDQMPDWQPYVP